jgi:hypothetical protein
MEIIYKLAFSGSCISVGWVLMARIESILRQPRRWAMSRGTARGGFLKAFLVFLSFGWAISLWTASVAVWLSWSLGWMLALAIPAMVVAGYLLARFLTGGFAAR